MQRIQVIDSHTGGEPTRLVIGGGPDLGTGSLAEQAARFRMGFDPWRRAIVCEPRGNEVLVGALLRPPAAPGCALGAIYFNTTGLLGMCGHATIGLIASLAWMGRIGAGVHGVDTPVGPVSAELLADGRVRVRNVPAYRHLAAVCLEVPGLGPVTGDVAWGGNWFFLVGDYPHRLDLAAVGSLTAHATAIRAALVSAGITGKDGAEIDHVELFGASTRAEWDSRNFVLCPGGAYDRSPCGTGTSAKLACLAAEGKLSPGRVWRQESITGSVFEARYSIENGAIIPEITGNAHVTAEASLVLDPADPFCWGL